jgi:hypothetical protein
MKKVFLVSCSPELTKRNPTVGMTIENLGVSCDEEYYNVLSSIAGPDIRDFPGWVDFNLQGNGEVSEYFFNNFMLASERIKIALNKNLPSGWNFMTGKFNRVGRGAVPTWQPFLMDARLILDVIDWQSSDYMVLPSGGRIIILSKIAFHQHRIPDEAAVFKSKDYPLLLVNEAGRMKMIEAGVPEDCLFALPLTNNQ